MTAQTPTGPELDPMLPLSYSRSPKPPIHPGDEWGTNPETMLLDRENTVVGFDLNNLHIRIPNTNKAYNGYRLNLASLHRIDGELKGIVLGSTHQDVPHEWSVKDLLGEAIGAVTYQYKNDTLVISTIEGEDYVSGWIITDVEQKEDGGMTAVIAIPGDETREPRRIPAGELVKMQMNIRAQKNGRAVLGSRQSAAKITINK